MAIETLKDAVTKYGESDCLKYILKVVKSKEKRATFMNSTEGKAKIAARKVENKKMREAFKKWKASQK